MEKLKRYSFYFITSFIFKKYLPFLVLTVTFIVNGFFISSVYALSENITQINFTSEPQFIDPDNLSNVMSIQTQNVDGNLEKVSETNHIILISSSPTGQFYNANASACTTLIESPFVLTMSSNTANKNFCYKDSTSGNHTLEIKVEGKTWTSAIQEITINREDTSVSDFTEIKQDINIDTVLTKENNPYVIKSIIHVLDGVTLTINNGVIVKFDEEGELIVDGKIDAQGTKLDPIYFTSFLDDTVGGYNIENGAIPNDTDKDGGMNFPSFDLWEGIWNGLTIKNTTLGSNLDNIILKYSNYGLIIYDTPVSSDGMELDRSTSLYRSTSNFKNLSTFGLNLYENSNSIIDDSIINDGIGSSAVSLYGDSVLHLLKSKINNAIRAVSVFENSSLLLDEVIIDSGENIGDGLFISGDDSSLTMTSSTITNIFNGVSLYNGANANISGSTFSCAGSCIGGNNADLLITDSKLFGDGSVTEEGYEKYGIYFNKRIYDGESGSGDFGLPSDETGIKYLFEINNNEIYNFDFGIDGSGGDIKGVNNSIHDNIIGASNLSIEDGGGIVDLKNNYWGDKTGPKNEISNPNGLGSIVSDNVLFEPFLLEDPFIIKKKDPVILIPGIMGTKLIKDYGDKDEIWPNISKLILSFFDNFLRDLELLPNGNKNLDYPLVIGDMVRETPTSNIFSGLISSMITDGEYIEGTDLFVFPYDWRLSNKDNALLLKEKVDQIIINTGADKIDIIAHSMGGLLAKSYISDYGKENVDQLIFLGTPHLGSPKAFKALMYGDDMGTNFGFLSLLNPNIVKDISQNMPSIFELLPSNKYINNIGKYVSSGGVNMDFNQTKDYMITEGRNEIMFPYTEELHNSLDDLDLSGIDVYNFANCDKYTIGKIDNFKKEKKNLFGTYIEDDYRLSYTAGDETVPFESANGGDYGIKYFTTGVSHTELPSYLGIKESIISILKNETPDTFENISTIYSDLSCKISGKVPSIHSPASMDIYDEFGNHTGPNEEGDMEYNIPGVSYDIIGDKKFAFLPDGGNYRIVSKALDIGSYDFYIDSFNDEEEKISETSFLNIPLSSLNTQTTIDINPNVTEYIVRLDDDGDGVFESNLNPGDNTSVDSINKSTSGYAQNNLPIIQNLIILDIVKPIILKEEDKIKNSNKELVNKMINGEEIKSENIIKNKEELLISNNLTAYVSRFNLDKRLVVPLVIVFGCIGLFLGVKFIFKIK